MNLENISLLLTALRGGKILKIKKEASTLRLEIFLPELAKSENPSHNLFYAALKECVHFQLQPFRNESMTLEELDEIERLQPQIQEATVSGEKIKVYCSHKGVSNGARLIVQAQELQVWNENFDLMTVADLAALRLNKK